MAASARVRWIREDLSDFGSPFSARDDSTSSEASSTSSLAYLNSQLVAHGFVSAPGISLDGTSMKDSERVVRCLTNLLGQRMDDMTRAEELTTRLRTLSYDHERLSSMHKTAIERAGNAEREVNLQKTRLAASTKTLANTVTAHKHTTTELQRTRTMIQGVRATHVAELKKRDKEIERMSEKWGKVADAQVKLQGTHSGIRFGASNVAIVEGSEVFGKGQGFLEEALEQSEASRSAMGLENIRLRRAVLGAANEVQDVLHATGAGASADEPVPFSLATLFPLAPMDHGYEKLEGILIQLKERVAAFIEAKNERPTLTSPTVPAPLNEKLEQLQSMVDSLKEELEQAQKAHTAHSQALFDQLAARPQPAVLRNIRETDDQAADLSTDLITAPAVDLEKDRLDTMKTQLHTERNKFTEATIKLGRERAAIEVERIKFQEEKRSWEVEKMLADLPPTPIPASSSRPDFPLPQPLPAAPRSPRKSPRKMVVGRSSPGKTGSGRKTRVSRRSSIGLGSPTSKVRVEPAYETEIIAAPLFAPAPTKKSPPMASLLPTSFVLPPVSPQSSMPKDPVVLAPSVAAPVPVVIHAPKPMPHQKTPPARAFPMAFRLTHAYSPAKPSPLSRILMMANSPQSPPRADSPPSPPARKRQSSSGDSLGMLLEEREGEEEEEEEEGWFPPMRTLINAEPLHERSLSPNLGRPGRGPAGGEGKKRYTATEKGKGKAPVAVQSRSPRKENRAKVGVRIVAAAPVLKAGRAARVSVPVVAAAVVVPSKTGAPGAGGTASSRARLVAKLPAGKGGAKRVSIDGWKG